jgi:hypothetical protein
VARAQPIQRVKLLLRLSSRGRKPWPYVHELPKQLTAVGDDPALNDMRIEIASQLAWAGDVEAALNVVQEIDGQEMQDSGYHRVAEACETRDQVDEALGVVDLIAGVDEQVQTLFDLAYDRAMRRDHETAVRLYERATELMDPDSYVAPRRAIRLAAILGKGSVDSAVGVLRQPEETELSQSDFDSRRASFAER